MASTCRPLVEVGRMEMVVVPNADSSVPGDAEAVPRAVLQGDVAMLVFS